MNYICPKCQHSLNQQQSAYYCVKCNKYFTYEGEFPNFLTYEKYFSDTSSEAIEKEEEANINKVKKYLVPLFKKLFKNEGPLKILSVGCGSAVEIDVLSDIGYEAWAVDTGDRINYWNRRKSKNLVIADGRNLPFPDKYFDVVMNFGVIEHVEETSSKNIRNRERAQYAKELLRVSKVGGYNIFGFPNRLFPIDFWHYEKHGMRFHSITNDFLASFKDINEYLSETKYSLMMVLPLKNYFSFKVTDFNPYLKIFIKPFNFYMNMVSSGPQFIRRSFLNPHLVIIIKK
ncbi:methyltransferase domain-containing protein [Patescibacteria group bacterium]|nr:methyltransferase domain-containing protein [Patescibacteria group bacterium]MBU1075497.1 methyltransferase domain-containing protein [Patescibacteria group bacterium]MBU1951363.1 methyltransferase domain-containing protein [Patescibacteria group bacterium]